MTHGSSRRAANNARRVHRPGNSPSQASATTPSSTVDFETNEIPMFSTLLDSINLLGALVTADALHGRRATWQPGRSGGGGPGGQRGEVEQPGAGRGSQPRKRWAGVPGGADREASESGFVDDLGDTGAVQRRRRAGQQPR
jgi:hypothetical protein